MSLQLQLTNLATRIATEFKSLRTLVNNNAGNLNGLSTTNKTSLVSAINELGGRLDAVAAGSGAINDSLASTTTTWSSTKTASAIGALIADTATTGNAKTYSVDKVLALIAQAKVDVTNSITGGASTALDTLKELADALGGDSSFAANVTTSLGNRIRADAAQTFTAPQKAQACANIGVGDPETDFVATFNAGLV